MIAALLSTAALSILFGAAPTENLSPTQRQQLDVKLTLEGRSEHPIVYLTREDLARARRNRERHAWAREAADALLKQADVWAAKEDAALRALYPAPGSCFAYGFSGCPICQGSIGTWGSGSSSFDDPGHVRCVNGHRLPDDEHPDPGTGWVDATGKKFYFVGAYNAFVIDALIAASTRLCLAYGLTGEERYARKAAILLDECARIYPACDKGSWDYPSDPPSGRLNRPWYQVARTLISYVHHYDLLMMGDALNTPSAVPGLTKRENIERNLLLNGARYCYEQSVQTLALHNGQADYIRGPMAVAAALGIPEYIAWGVDGPFSIRNMIENNLDRDGHYYETSSSYSDHTRYLYMDIAEILRNYRDRAHPQGIPLAAQPKFRAFYLLPQSRLRVSGHPPNLGDDSPNVRHLTPTVTPTPFDLSYLEKIHALTPDGAEKQQLAQLLLASYNGDVEKGRAANTAREWLLFHADELGDSGRSGAERRATNDSKPPNGTPDRPMLHPLTGKPLGSSDLLAQKGLAILRSGSGADARALTLRAGPTLNHGHLDELNLSLYARGYDLTYDLGYGLGSTHTQVGWSKQTASHNTVLVDETSQLQAERAGGTVEHFADLPGLKLVQVDDPAAYAAQGVRRYQRTVAMVDAGPDGGYVLDLFRVEGGRRHDYVFHGQGTRFTTEGLTLGDARPGSLAGADVDWGAHLGVDGDVIGIANKPYWNPPPGNGFGFLLGPRSATPTASWSAEWQVGETPPARLRLTMLPTPGTEVTVAEAPGIYPRLPRAKYVLARRAGANLSSIFAAVLEPYGEQRVVREVTSLAPVAGNARAAVAAKVTLAGSRVDYLFHADAGRGGSWRDGAQEVRFTGGFGKVGVDGAGITDLTLIGGNALTAGGLSAELERAAYEGRIERIDFERNILYTHARLPEGDTLAGGFVSLGNTAYSQRSLYRIASVSREGDLTALQLAPTTLILGRAHLGAAPSDAHALPNIVPLEYAKRVGRQSSGFFRGKRVATPDGRAATHLRDVAGTTGIEMTAESTRGFRAGDDLVIYDVQAGDTFSLPCWAHVQRLPDGRLQARANAALTLTWNGRRYAVSPTGEGETVGGR